MARAMHPCGTIRDRADARDRAYAIPSRLRKRLPAAVDLRPGMPPVYNQLHLNSCSAHAIAAALWFEGGTVSWPTQPGPSAPGQA